MQMGRNDIIKELAERIYGNATVSEIQQCTLFCDTLVDIFKESLLNEGKISWKGFLTANVVERGERKGKNPKTNEVTVFPPVKSINCKFSKSIKNLINNK